MSQVLCSTTGTKSDGCNQRKNKCKRRVCLSLQMNFYSVTIQVKAAKQYSFTKQICTV